MLDDVRVVDLARQPSVGGAGGRQVVVALDDGQEDVLPTALAGIARGEVVLVRMP